MRRSPFGSMRGLRYTLVYTILFSLASGTDSPPPLSPEISKWNNNTAYSRDNQRNVRGRIVLNGETYHTTCTCLPSDLQAKTSCRAQGIDIRGRGYFGGPHLRGTRRYINGKNLRKLLGSPVNLRNVEINKAHFSCVDGRSSDEVMGTWGGDAGELMLALAVYEDIVGKDLSNEDIHDFILQYLSFSARDFFYIHTDTKALGWLSVQSGIYPLDITQPPSEAEYKLSQLLVQPEAIGCHHLRTLIQLPESYLMRPQLPSAFLQQLHAILWDRASALRNKILYYVLSAPGTRSEVAWVNFQMQPNSSCSKETRTVVFPPFSDDVSIFVNHPHATTHMRNSSMAYYIYRLLTKSTPLKEIQEQIHLKAALWKKITDDAFKRTVNGLPIYDVVITP